MPGTDVGVAVVAPLALVICRRTLLSTPDRQGLVVDFVGVLKGIADVVEPVRFYTLAWLGSSKSSVISDDLDILDLLTTLFKIDMLHEEKTAFHPLESDLSLRIAGYLPRANQSIQAFETRIRLGWLLCSFSVSVFLCHKISPFE